MKLPNGDRAIVDIAKLRDYCLDPSHPRGKHKARVFASALGLSIERADELKQALEDSASILDVTQGETDEYGKRFVKDFIMLGPSGQASVRSAWIILAGENLPRLITCYVL